MSCPLDGLRTPLRSFLRAFTGVFQLIPTREQWLERAVRAYGTLGTFGQLDPVAELLGHLGLELPSVPHLVNNVVEKTRA